MTTITQIIRLKAKLPNDSLDLVSPQEIEDRAARILKSHHNHTEYLRKEYGEANGAYQTAAKYYEALLGLYGTRCSLPAELQPHGPLLSDAIPSVDVSLLHKAGGTSTRAAWQKQQAIARQFATQAIAIAWPQLYGIATSITSQTRNLWLTFKTMRRRPRTVIAVGLAGLAMIVTQAGHKSHPKGAHSDSIWTLDAADTPKAYTLSASQKHRAESALAVFEQFQDPLPGQKTLLQKRRDQAAEVQRLTRQLNDVTCDAKSKIQGQLLQAEAGLKALPKLKTNDPADVINGVMTTVLATADSSYSGTIKQMSPEDRFVMLLSIPKAESRYNASLTANNKLGHNTAAGSHQIMMPELFVTLWKNWQQLPIPVSGQNLYSDAGSAIVRIAAAYSAKRHPDSLLLRKAWEASEGNSKLGKDVADVQRILRDPRLVDYFGVKTSVGASLGSQVALRLNDEGKPTPKAIQDQYGLATDRYLLHNQGPYYHRLMLRDLAEIDDPKLFAARYDRKIADLSHPTDKEATAITNAHRLGVEAARDLAAAQSQLQAMKKQRRATGAYVKKQQAATADAKHRQSLARQQEQDASHARLAALTQAKAFKKAGPSAQWQRDIEGPVARSNPSLYYRDGKKANGLLSPRGVYERVQQTIFSDVEPQARNLFRSALARFFDKDGHCILKANDKVPYIILRNGHLQMAQPSTLAQRPTVMVASRRAAPQTLG